MTPRSASIQATSGPMRSWYTVRSSSFQYHQSPSASLGSPPTTPRTGRRALPAPTIQLNGRLREVDFQEYFVIPGSADKATFALSQLLFSSFFSSIEKGNPCFANKYFFEKH